MKPNVKPEQGPFKASQVTPQSRYELSRGHPIWCAPGGGRHATTNAIGTLPLSTDPAVSQIGIDVGYTPTDDSLRAPDIAVGNVPPTPGWVEGAPPLAVEYADTGTDEQDLQQKIRELIQAGTRFIWVVRLTGPRRVEVYEPHQTVKIAEPGSRLNAPGVLQNSVPVEALYNQETAFDTALKNLLQRRGYRDVNAIREEGISQGISQGKQTGTEDTFIKLFEQKLGEPLDSAQLEVLRRKIRLTGDEVYQVVLSYSRDQMLVWLKD